MMDNMKTNKTTGMKLTWLYPRELSFYHEDYQAGCGETETPFIGSNGKTFLYVWNTKEKHYAYYCFEEDLFWSEKDYELVEEMGKYPVD
jgi:hypothetical protein